MTKASFIVCGNRTVPRERPRPAASYCQTFLRESFLSSLSMILSETLRPLILLTKPIFLTITGYLRPNTLLSIFRFDIADYLECIRHLLQFAVLVKRSELVIWPLAPSFIDFQILYALRTSYNTYVSTFPLFRHVLIFTSTVCEVRLAGSFNVASNYTVRVLEGLIWHSVHSHNTHLLQTYIAGRNDGTSRGSKASFKVYLDP